MVLLSKEIFLAVKGILVEAPEAVGAAVVVTGVVVAGTEDVAQCWLSAA